MTLSTETEDLDQGPSFKQNGLRKPRFNCAKHMLLMKDKL